MSDAKLDQINERLHSIDKTLTVNTEHLAQHMARTKQIEDALAPVVKHVQQMQGAAKLLGLLALIAGIISVAAVFK